MKRKNDIVRLFAAGALILSSAVAMASDEHETYGAITAISTNGLSIAGEGFVFASNVECEYLNKVRFACSQLAVGDTVKVEWEGNRIAREIKLYSSNSPSPTPTISPSPTPTPNNDGRRREKESKVSARLRSAALGVKPSGKVEYESKKNEQKLSVKVRIPEGSSPLIENLEQAQALQLTAQFLRDSAVYAECDFVFDDHSDDEDPDATNIYEFKVDVRTKKGVLREKKGACVIDPAGAATSGVPEVKRQDSIKILEDSAGEFLTGTAK